jgi:hypothetical protein
MNKQKFKYVEIEKHIDKNTFQALESDVVDDVINALLSIVWYSSDYQLSVISTRKFFESENEFIKGASIECIGHIARIFKKLPNEFIEKVKVSLQDESFYIKVKAEFSFEDLKIFIMGYENS